MSASVSHPLVAPLAAAPADAGLAALEARYQARLARERAARKQAERLLEDRSLALYQANQALKQSAESLEQLVAERTQALLAALEDAKAATEAKSRFLAGYPSFFTNVTGVLPFLAAIEVVIHAEVLKLYPDAQLPRFEYTLLPDGLEMVYFSPRHFDDLAEGLIEGAVAHWQRPF